MSNVKCFAVYDIITIGSAVRDVFMEDDSFVVVKNEQFPEGKAECFPLGSKIDIDKIVFTTGGGATNSAVTFARQGFKTACLSVIGKDMEGKNIRNELEKEGISTELFQEHNDETTSYSVILVHVSGARTILHYEGEKKHFDLRKIDFDKIQAKWLYIGAVGGHWEVLDALIEHAKKNNIKLAINTTGSMFNNGPEAIRKIAPLMDIFTTNLEEGAQVTGIDPKDWKGIVDALFSMTGNIVSVSNGPEGVIVVDQTGKKYKADIPDSPAVERTGAGDAFASGFVSELMRNKRGSDADFSSNYEDIVRAIQLATANATSVVQYFGAKQGILKKGDNGPWPLVEVNNIK